MSQSLASLTFHFVFSTKHRRPLITPEIEPRLYDFIGGILRSTGSQLIEPGGMPDHVHLLASLAKQLSVVAALREIKSVSSAWIHNTFRNRRRFAWQSGYAAFSVSQSDISRVREYIRRQKEHHRKKSFKDELRELLEAHDVEFDERYLWD